MSALYLQHFGLREAPFSLTPDTEFFFAAAPHQEALNVLLVALREGEGFIKVTGEVGLGKTLLCRLLLNRLGAPQARGAGDSGLGAGGRSADPEFFSSSFRRRPESSFLHLDSGLRRNDGNKTETGIKPVGAASHAANAFTPAPSPQPLAPKAHPPRASGASWLTAYIPNPHVSPGSLRLSLAEELGIESGSRPTQEKLHRLLTEHLIALAQQDKKVVLCLDEAQALPAATLETVRLLTNLETEKSKLLQVVLFGQPELDRRLKQHHWRQLRQRITFSYQLTPLDEPAVRAYVQHRLKVAGYRGRPLFSAAALKIVRRAAHGTPRLINILCHKAMLAAYGRGQESIETAHIRSAVRDTEGAFDRWWQFHLPGWLPAMTAVLLVGLVWLGVRQ